MASKGILFRLVSGFMIYFCYLIWPLINYLKPKERKTLPRPENPIFTNSAKEIAIKIRRRQVSASEVIKAFIDRQKEVNPIINAVVENRYEDALAEAKEVDDFLAKSDLSEDDLENTKPLLGVPLTVKENLSLKGMSLAVGSKTRLGIKAEEDGDAVKRLSNFQANITSQFEALRDDEDFTDVTIAVEGQRLQAHKVVLSACSPYFKELFKSNPCSHPIIFMRDVEARHVVALMEFMYAGEVNVAQAHLSSFLKTAESLKIRGLTDTSNDLNQRDDDTLFLNPQPSKSTATDTKSRRSALNAAVACSSTVTSSEDVGTTDAKDDQAAPPTKRQCKTDDALRTEERLTRIEETVCATNPFDLDIDKGLQPKIELPDYLSDEERDDGRSFFHTNNDLTGGMEIIQQGKLLNVKDVHPETNYGPMRHRPQMTKTWSPFDLRSHSGSTSPDLMACLRDTTENRDPARRNRLVKLGEGIEIYEDQLRSVKWSDYRKLTRGLATILFSPAELASCSVTGQRWSRAGSGERPVKPALDRAKVQAIISYVATRFPMIEISRIKQVLAYKCKENSTAFKMKAVRYYGDQVREPDKN